MSRTKRGAPSPGKDYWGKRPLEYGAQGKRKNKRKEKQLGIQKERTILKRQLKKEVESEET